MKLRATKIIVIGCVFAGTATISSADNITPVQDAFLTFESLCLVYSNHPDALPGLLKTLGAMEMKPEDAKSMLYPQSGRGYFLKGQAETFFVMLTDAGICGLQGKYADPKTTVALFKQNTRNRLLDHQIVGSETQEVYAVTYPGPDNSHSVVMVQMSNMPITAGVRFVNVPESALEPAGITVPPWP